MIKDSVAVGYVHPNEVSESFHQCMLSLMAWDAQHEGHITNSGGWLAASCYGGDALPAARNRIVEQFLESDCEWLMWIDTDMGFAPDTVDRLLEAADAIKRPIMGALCFAYKQGDSDNMGGFRMHVLPTIFDWRSNGEYTGFMSRREYPINTVIRCAGTGGACILIHRSSLVAIQEAHGAVWYDRVENPTSNNALIGEDLSLCLRAGALKIPIHVHTGVRTTHHKTTWVSETDYWRYNEAPPATEKTAILVPVMRRPENAESFMRSLKASTGLATVYALCDQDDPDTIKAWRAVGAKTMCNNYGLLHAGTFSEKVNYGWLHTKEPWTLIVGDDVKFHAGWLDHAQAVAGDRYDVIGTNDLGNPRVLSGEHATHLLIRRTYVQDVGASFDSPGVIAHEGYRHCYVDDEIVTAAKQRNTWAMALGSIIEHKHPLWSDTPDDAVYKLGRKYMIEDQRLYLSRLQTNGK